MDYLVLFLLGTAVGSFLNVVIYRLRTGQSAVKGRSCCDHCGKKIDWFDNIPLLSYIILKGKCRKCKKKIPLEYFWLELLTGAEFVWVYWLLKVNFEFFGSIEGFYSLGLLVYWLILFAGSLTIAVFDIKYLLIPDEVLVLMVGAAGLRLILTQQWMYLVFGILSSLLPLSLWLLTKGKGMGLGDVKLGFLMGLVLGFPQILVAYFVAFLTGAVTGVILILTKQSNLKAKIAFGPFLLLGMLVAKLWGMNLWTWYINLL